MLSMTTATTLVKNKIVGTMDQSDPLPVQVGHGLLDGIFNGVRYLPLHFRWWSFGCGFELNRTVAIAAQGNIRQKKILQTSPQMDKF